MNVNVHEIHSLVKAIKEGFLKYFEILERKIHKIDELEKHFG